MSLSSSSNADPGAAPTFKVSTRALTADLAAARIDESPRELGAVDTSRLTTLLEKLAALDPPEVAEADPQLVVTGRRGRFAIRPGRGRFLLRAATDGAQNYVELAATDIPVFLDGKDVQAPAPVESPASLAPPPPAGSRRGIALALFAFAALVVATSAWLTFRSEVLDPDSDYVLLSAPTEISELRQQATGTFTTGSGDDERVIDLKADGTTSYREYGPDRELADERTGPYTFARRRSDQVSVLRVRDLGTIELKSPNSIVFAHDTFRRRGAAEPANR